MNLEDSEIFYYGGHFDSIYIRCRNCGWTQPVKSNTSLPVLKALFEGSSHKVHRGLEKA